MYRLKELDNGFKYIELTNAVSSAKIALQGAHIYEYKRQNQEDILWLSENSSFEEGVAIRGGIPICWPRFGVLDKDMPAHGFSRTAIFSVKNVREIDSETTEVTLVLKDTPQSRKIWNYIFELEVVFIIGKTLKVTLTTYNRGEKEFMITEALHTYFNISDINNISISGLEKVEFIDTLCNEKRREFETISIDSECDRVYQGKSENIELRDTDRTIFIKAEGSNSTVVWNPWIEKGSKMNGIKEEGYKEFVCIESANAFDDKIFLKEGESYTLSASFKT